jgi:hypothetical protein
MTVLLTVVSGTAVYVIGQIIQRFFLDPVLELRRTIADIGEALIFHANLFANPVRSSAAPLPENYMACSCALRAKASLLRAKAYAVPWYPLFCVLGVAPCAKSLGEASTDLILLSNSLGGEHTNGKDNANVADRIKHTLGLRF